MPRDVEKRRHEIEPLQQLALDIVFDGVRGWVAAEGTPLNGGWLRSDRRRLEDVRSAVAEVRAFLGSRPLPRSIAGIVEARALDRQVSTAIHISDNLRVFQVRGGGVCRDTSASDYRLQSCFLSCRRPPIGFTIVLDDYRLRYR
jgi:hypothetical protein